MINNVVLLGRLTRDPEIKHSASGVAVVNFNVAVDRRFVKQGEQRQADFINVVAFRTTAEFVSKYFTKGQMIAVTGSIQTRNYDNNEGKKVYVTEVIAEQVSFAGSKNESGGAPRPAGDGGFSRPNQIGGGQPFAPVDDSGFMPIDNDDDLPF